jgi:hypothetical protein
MDGRLGRIMLASINSASSRFTIFGTGASGGAAASSPVGDAASVMQNEHPVPGVARAAIQEGRYVGRLIAKELKGRKVKRPFRYFDKGNMAVVGKNYAVLERGWLRTSGFLTWLVWAFVHILGNVTEMGSRGQPVG